MRLDEILIFAILLPTVLLATLTVIFTFGGMLYSLIYKIFLYPLILPPF